MTGRANPFKRFSPTVLLLVVLLAACAPMPARHRPAPEAASGATGLLVLNTSVRIGATDLGPTSRERVTDGVLLPVRPRGAARRGEATNGILIFADLPPGQYRLALVNVRRQQDAAVVQDAFLVPPGVIKRLTFRVTAGAVVYGGAVHVEREKGGTGERGIFHVSLRKADELRTWNSLLKLYGDSRWGAVIRKRIAVLQGGH